MLEPVGEKNSMLRALSPMIAVCLMRAHEAHERADVAPPGPDRRFWHDVERQWLKLAQSYEVAERLDAFIEAQRRDTLH
jgi:hypothetical protein